MAGLAAQKEPHGVVEEHTGSLVDNGAAKNPDSGAFWVFEEAKSTFWTLLGSSFRHRLATSQASLARTLSRSQPLLVAYHRQPSGAVSYAQVMDFRSTLGIPPETLHARILKVIESLESQGPPSERRCA